jgi:glycosyltransferase involved in cell wall biosynthesis
LQKLSTNRSKTITHLNFASGYRGGERQTTLLIQELSERGCHQQLFTRVESELAERCAHIKNLKIVRINKPYIGSFVKFKHAQIIHAHETKGAQVAFLLNKLFNTPYIITRRVDNKIKDNFFTRAMYSNASCCIALSQAIKKGILDRAAQANIAVIPSAQTDFNIDKDKVVAIGERFSGKFLVGNIGELENAHKGQLYLIEAIKRLAHEYPNIHFIFLGKGKDKQLYQELTNGLENTTFEGFVDNVADYIACMDLFVFPSLNEGLGSILLDVMKLKVPVIASNIGGIPDIVIDNETGVLVEPKNSEAIYQQILALYNNQPFAKKLADTAYQNTFNYSSAVMADAYQKLYNTL